VVSITLRSAPTITNLMTTFI